MKNLWRSSICTLSIIFFCSIVLAHSIPKQDAWEPAKPQLEFLVRLSVETNGTTYEFGKIKEFGTRRIIPITGGHFEGPLLKGTILNQGADYQIAKSDGLKIVEAHYILKTEDGALIYLSTKGFKWAEPAVQDAMKTGPVDPSQYFFKQYISFETADLRYEWLNHSLAIGTLMRSTLGNKDLLHDIYLVK